jgi:hypothetical protein
MTHEGLWLQLSKLESGVTAGRAKCEYLEQSGQFRITFLNQNYLVDPVEKKIVYTGGESETGFLEQLCILAYLINVRDLPLADKYVGPELLKGGQFFFRGPHSLPTGKLEEVFGREPHGLLKLIDIFNAEPYNFGDASIRLLMFPRIPLTIVIWRECDEFPARAQFLFDQTAAEHLPLDALWTAVKLTVNALVKAAGELS